MHLVRRLATLGSWLEAVDPAALRRTRGAHAVLATLTTGLVLRGMVLAGSGRPLTAVVLFGVAICFTAALVIAEPRRRDRQVTMALGAVVIAAATSVTAAVGSHTLLGALVLLGMIFCSFACRRWGLRAGELALLATMAVNAAWTFGASTDRIGWYVLAAGTGIASLWLWQFVLVPYRRARSLDHAVDSFLEQSGLLVAAVDRSMHVASISGGAIPERDLGPSLRRVELSRRVIASQFPGVLAPQGWTSEQVDRLHLALFDAERGLDQLVAAVSGDAAARLPADLASTLSRVVQALESLLGSANGDAASSFFGASVELQREARARVAPWAGAGDERAAPPEWLATVVRASRGCARTARALEAVRRIEDETGAGASRDHGADAAPARALKPARVPAIGRVSLHPTTALGVQAALATGVAMLLAAALQMERPNWVFWSAFVVIAGSAGESLRRVALRVLGTLAGATVGVILVLATPANLPMVVGITATAAFFAVFFAPASYSAMVFWTNLGFVVVLSRLGADTFDLLLERPLTTLIGALVAAVVALVVFPVRVTARYRQTLAGLLDAVGDGIDRWVAVALARVDREEAVAATLRVERTYEEVERTLPNVAFESNPFVQARSPLTGQAIHVAALIAEFRHLSEAADEPGDVDPARRPATVAVHRRLRDDVGALASFLRGQPGVIHASLTDVLGAAASSVGGFASAAMATGRSSAPASGPTDSRPVEPRLLPVLAALHGSVVALADDVGAPLEPPRRRRARLGRRAR